jgi:hypothetical protein
MGGLLVGYMWYWSGLIVNANIKSSLHGKNTGACSSMLATVDWGEVTWRHIFKDLNGYCHS